MEDIKLKKTYKLKTIDIEKVLRDKTGKNYNKIPGFAIRYLKSIVHENELNEILEKFSDLSGVAFMSALVKHFNIKLNIECEENIPEEGKFTFASNHPLGGLDGICLSSFLGEKYKGKIKYLVNDVLYYIPQLKPIFVPINKYGSQGRETAKSMNEAYASDNQIITFPAGLCSRKTDGKIRDLKWHKNFVQKSRQHNRDIIPVHFSGKNSNFFYNFALIRKRLGIKFNIELIYLPDEMFKNRNELFTITFGKPIRHEELDRSKTDAQWAAHIIELIYQLPDSSCTRNK